MSDFEIETVDQLLAIALAAERDVSAQYLEISKRMQIDGNNELADLFGTMAESERQHAKELEKMVQKMGIEELPEVPNVSWHHPNVRNDQERATNPRTSTPYLALAYAVDNEELAFRFYSYVAANAKDDKIRRFAEAFAKEELAHAALFREQRRAAYHQQAPETGMDESFDPSRIGSPADLLLASVNIERSIRRLFSAANDLGMDLSQSAAKSDAMIKSIDSELEDLHGQTAASAAADTIGAAEDSLPSSREEIQKAIMIAAERAFMFYDNITDSTEIEAVMLRAQELTQLALERMDELGTLFDE